MPRGGSKKGEHRGNAKARQDGTPNAIMRSAVVKPKGGQSRRPSSVETDVAIAQVIHGIRSADDMTPKQVMLDNMHNFQNAAYQYEAMVRFHAERLPDTEETRRAIRNFEMEAERNRRIASDEAYKVAGFVHPRLAAIAVKGDLGAGDDIVKMLFDEIDRKNREHPMVIEHIPQKKTA